MEEENKRNFKATKKPNMKQPEIHDEGKDRKSPLKKNSTTSPHEGCNQHVPSKAVQEEVADSPKRAVDFQEDG